MPPSSLPGQEPPAPPAPPPAPPAHRIPWVQAGLGAFVLVIIGGVAYAFAQGLIPTSFFSSPPYGEGKELQGIAEGISRIESASYEVSLRAFTELRDPGAEPFSSSEEEVSYLAELGTDIPTDFDATFAIGGAAQKGDSVNAQLSVDAALSAGDLMMQFSAEARKVGEDLYFYIGKIPALFGGVSELKGKWIKITAEEQKEMGADLDFDWDVWSEASEEERAEARERISKIIETADRHELFVVDAPVREMLEGAAFRYDLRLRPEAVEPFYRDMMREYPDTFDQAELDELLSDESRDALEKIAKNTRIRVWVDTAGVPRKSELSFRYVPPDEVGAYEHKQVRIIVGLVLRNINEPVVIDAPSPTISLEEALDFLGMSVDDL